MKLKFLVRYSVCNSIDNRIGYTSAINQFSNQKEWRYYINAKSSVEEKDRKTIKEAYQKGYSVKTAFSSREEAYEHVKGAFLLVGNTDVPKKTYRIRQNYRCRNFMEHNIVIRKNNIPGSNKINGWKINFGKPEKIGKAEIKDIEDLCQMDFPTFKAAKEYLYNWLKYYKAFNDK